MNSDNTPWEDLIELYQHDIVSDYASDKGITLEEAFRTLYIGVWNLGEEEE